MKVLSIALAVCLMSSAVSAKGLDACEFESDFDLRIGADALTFQRDEGTPATVVMRQGELIVDGQVLELSAADRTRVRRIEVEVRALVPEVKAIALDALGIASDALIHVATSLSGRSNDEAARRARELTDQLRARITDSRDSRDWRDGEFERAVAGLTAELVPALVGNVAAIAVQAALSGDTDGAAALEARMEAFEKELETRIQARAGEIEARADALCPRLAELDALESGLELRLAGQVALDLIRIER
jgi:hypothetical protein